MKIIIAACCIYFIGLSSVSNAQAISGIKKEAVQALLDSADIYRLKAPARALQYSMEILSQVPVEGNEIIYTRALLYASNSQKMLSQKEDALKYASQAIAIAHKVADPELLLRSYFQKASIFGQEDNIDSALVYYQHVISFHRAGLDPYYASGAYSFIGEIYNSIGNLQKAEEYLLKGYRLANTDEYSKMFALSPVIQYYASHDNPKYLTYLDTLANSDFYKKASPASFMAHFESFLALDESSDERKEKTLSEVYTYSITHSSLTNQIGYGFKLYDHLDKLKRYDEAHHLLLELRQKAIEVKNGYQLSTIAHSLYENSKSRGELDSALIYLEQHSHLRDSLLSDENTDRISELNIKFESAQKDHEIAQQKARILQERRDRNFFIILAFLLSALAILVYVFFRNRARTLKRIAQTEKVIHRQDTERLQKENEVAQLTATLESQEKERNRIARDLHDGIGSMMSGISSQIEFLHSQPVFENSGHSQLAQLRELVKDATSELRRTSYELMPAKLLRLGLEPAISDICLNLLIKNGIQPSLEINADLTTLNPEQQLTLYRIIQELFNNIVKHSEAKQVLIQFNQYYNEISLVVEDDGKGFNVANQKLNGGLGLGSLVSRVNLLKGFLDIASMPGEGTTVTVNFNV
ncbi:MAG TPA: sensor histidine kinase [Saprospiraceae bacterium]|nr:sensor histidine kinase [Saprospiraceae bacterium]